MKLMLLGSSKAQLNTIKKIQNLGHEVIASDYHETSVGKNIANDTWLASTFDYAETLKGAVAKSIDGIMTMGTDQPVLTVAKVANTLNLPYFLDIDTALSVTNKAIMKQKFIDYQIPTTNYVLYEPSNPSVLEKVKFPAVIKPLDSQGQRGIYVVNSIDEIQTLYSDVISYSREKSILIESYYANDEITISGWVEAGELKVLTITDRVTFDSKDEIGICLSHEFPSKHTKEYGQAIVHLSKKIVKDFKIQSGPIYFQFFIGEEGLKVNEIACRIGGAYEDEFIPYLTGVDLLHMTIMGSLGIDYSTDNLINHDVFSINKHLSVQLFFSNPCKICDMPTEDEIRKLEGVVNVGFNYHVGDTIPKISNATQRIGYVIVAADSKQQLEKRLSLLYKHLKIIDENSNNVIIHRKLEE
ncbi:ATP-grasp domain-containing protein [Oceanirhabdus sp. W0125-5]|uniref:ATP-grasp domain-containing protein n=1 Tax=Oceanirhabdus sp. W0125-5 TaxID=2999116 RepID=UPI0022F339F5|nr:ATP-grasp domain-containing protein [Oceanirhabdus sp. W0125-5]WBW98864.1 ATP-grasp domain-containing protein [Oceanirhabdus sp. W0125-5]